MAGGGVQCLKWLSEQASGRLPAQRARARWWDLGLLATAACTVGVNDEKKGRREKKVKGMVKAKTHLYGLPPLAACCSVVMMGFRSVLRFLPLPLEVEDAALATFLAFSIAAFLIPSEPFMMVQLE